MGEGTLEERAAATLRLLWRHAEGHPPERPGRSGLTVDAVIDAAIEVADAEGLGSLTMRRVAEALGVSAMTPYRYVPAKAELLDLMVDAVYSRMRVTMRADAPWREQAAAVARDNRALHRDHPWTLHVSPVRPPPGPGLLAKYERELRAFEGIGLADHEMDAALSHLLGMVRATALVEVEGAAAVAESGADDRRWWEAVGPLLADLIDEAAYPLAARVASAAGEAHGSAHDADVVFTFGLARFLDGIEALIRARQGR